MDWKLWKPKYEEIVKKLRLDKERDKEAAKTLNQLLTEKDTTKLREQIKNKQTIIFGAGPSLEKDLEKLSGAGCLDKVLISADGATTAVMKFKNPDIIVTDLDGDMKDQLKSWKKGSWMIVHAHGDNIKKVEKYVPQLTERVLGTVQVDFPQLPNFGGFTDGDRAAFISHELGASRIFLAGMDFGEKIGKYTGQTNKERKLIKLNVGKKLLSWLATDLGADLVNITSEGEDIPNVSRKEITPIK